MTSIREQVTEFHVAMGVPVMTTPRELDRDRLELRLKLIAEECLELLDAAGYWLVGRDTSGKPLIARAVEQSTGPLRDASFDMVEVADALGDIDYVVQGMRIELGIDGAPIAAEIHRTNMLKTTGPIREDGKRMKPEGWLPPDIRGLLIAQGWVPPGEVK